MVGFDNANVAAGAPTDAPKYEWREQRGKSIWVPIQNRHVPATKRSGAAFPEYTLEQIAKHNKPDDLWIIINGRVYDLSKWAIHHPGGHLCLENLAGADGTDPFENYHPAYVYEKKLPRFQVGIVADSYQDPEFVKEYRAMRQRLLAEGMYETRPSFYYFQVMWIASLLTLSVYLTAFCDSFGAHSLGAVAMGFFWHQLAFVGHDVAHNAISHIKSKDHFFSVTFGNALMGISVGWWKWSHNVHHVITNSIEHDPDIQHLPVMAVDRKIFKKPFWSTFHAKVMSLDAAARALVARQHYLYYLTMALARFNLYVQSFILIFSKEQWGYKWLEFPSLMCFWVWYGYLLSFLPSYTEIAFYLLFSHVVSGILHVQITLSHFSMDTYYGRNTLTNKQDNWFNMQLSTSMDVASNIFTEWFHGGLQYQVEHHLFPRLPRHNLKYAATLVKEFAEKHGLRYHRPGFIQGNMEVIASLARAAKEVQNAPSGTEAFTKSMLWDAMNARG